MKHLLIGMVACCSFLMACNNNPKYDINSSDLYEKEKAVLENLEKKDPVRFLSVTGNDKKNLLGQTVIKGTVFNKAKLVHFKDIQIKLLFYSQTGTLLGQDIDTVYETISPGGSTAFKSKNFAPKGTDSVVMKIISAKF